MRGSALAAFCDEVARRGVRVAVFGFDGVMVPNPTGAGASFDGPGLHPLAHGFLALAGELAARKIYLAIVTNNRGATLRRVVGPGQPPHLRHAAAALQASSGVFARVLTREVHAGRRLLADGSQLPHGDTDRRGLPVPPLGAAWYGGGPGFRGVEKNGAVRLVCRRARLDGVPFTAAAEEAGGEGCGGASETLLVDASGPACAAWVALGGHAYQPLDARGVGLEVALDPGRIHSGSGAFGSPASHSARPAIATRPTSSMASAGEALDRSAARRASDVTHWDQWVRLWEDDGRDAGTFWE
jgi:hypothetical protein